MRNLFESVDYVIWGYIRPLVPLKYVKFTII